MRYILILFIFCTDLFSKPKDIIILIADGMGINSMSFGDLLWNMEEFKNFSDFGIVKPYPVNSKYYITDSAAAGTAIACGKKTLNGRICIDEKGNRLESIAYRAKKNRKSVGIITNTRITHATPAVFYANHIDREMENEIAHFIPKSNFDLFIGGGWKYINLVEEELFKNGYEIVRKKEDIDINVNKIIGIFSDSHMSYEIDRKDSEPSLSYLVDFSLRFLSKNKKGFLMIVESGRIDHCEHDNDIVCLAYEMKELKEVMKVIFNYVSKNRDSLFVMLSDHSNGGLSLGRDANEVLNIEPIKNAKSSAFVFSKETEKVEDYDLFKQKYFNNFGIFISFRDFDDIKNKRISLLEPFNVFCNIKWSTNEHEASYVGIFSYWNGAENFRGFMDIDEIGRKLFNFI
ncbi:MAG: alkaline phosphatase [Elusimicrobiales bacterium]|nr:alkaline phosphatase [Elusimicrobiales bacterium]